MTGERPPKVFISYSHDSREHAERILALSNRLRGAGVDTILDQYETSPSEGWPRWMERCIREADFVLMCCTETYYRRVMGEEDAGVGLGVRWEGHLIYQHIYDAGTENSKFIPILLEGGASGHIPVPLRGVTFYRVDTDEGYEDLYRRLTSRPRTPKPGLGSLKRPQSTERQWTKRPTAWPSPNAPADDRRDRGPLNPGHKAGLFTRAPSDEIQHRYRQRVLERLKADWLQSGPGRAADGVIFELDLALVPDSVARPSGDAGLPSEWVDRRSASGDMVAELFDGFGGEMLILGAPGAGKTFLLYALARELLARAENDGAQPVPVILHLTSWSQKRQPIADWLVGEIKTHYRVPFNVSRAWIRTGGLLPLFDSLDGVRQEDRAGCIAALNAFCAEHGLLKVAVCCRTLAYESVNARLGLRGAVLVQPLKSEQLEAYLAKAGAGSDALRATLRSDEVLREIARAPLMFNFMRRVYAKSPAEEAAPRHESIEERRARLFTDYVRYRLRQAGPADGYTPERTVRYLSWLARKMKDKPQTIFLIERMQPDWLTSHRWLYRAAVGVSVASVVIVSLWPLFWMNGVSKEPSDKFALVLIGLISGAAVGAYDQIKPVESLSWSWLWSWVDRSLLKKWVEMLRDFAEALPALAILMTLGGVVFSLRESWRRPEFRLLSSLYETLGVSHARGLARTAFVLLDGLGFGLVVGVVLTLLMAVVGPLALTFHAAWVYLLGGLIRGVFFGVRGPELAVEQKVYPNQGIRDSAVNALIVALFAVSLLGLLDLLTRLLDSSDTAGVNAWFYLMVASIVALSHAAPCLKHYLLRFVLWRQDKIPGRYVRFLGYAERLDFLTKVGGGYKFSHDLLQEYFAGLRETAGPNDWGSPHGGVAPSSTGMTARGHAAT